MRQAVGQPGELDKRGHPGAAEHGEHEAALRADARLLQPHVCGRKDSLAAGPGAYGTQKLNFSP